MNDEELGFAGLSDLDVLVNQVRYDAGAGKRAVVQSRLAPREPKQDVDMRRYFTEGARLVTEGAINTSDLVTHKVPLSQIAKAFDLKKEPSGDVIHVMVDCQS